MSSIKEVSNEKRQPLSNTFFPSSHTENVCLTNHEQRKQFKDLSGKFPDQIKCFLVVGGHESTFACLLCKNTILCRNLEQHLLSPLHVQNLALKHTDSFRKFLRDKQSLLEIENQKFLDCFPASEVFICTLCNLSLISTWDLWLEHFKSDFHKSRLPNSSVNVCKERLSAPKIPSECKKMYKNKIASLDSLKSSISPDEKLNVCETQVSAWRISSKRKKSKNKEGKIVSSSSGSLPSRRLPDVKLNVCEKPRSAPKISSKGRGNNRKKEQKGLDGTNSKQVATNAVPLVFTYWDCMKFIKSLNGKTPDPVLDTLNSINSVPSLRLKPISSEEKFSFSNPECKTQYEKLCRKLQHQISCFSVIKGKSKKLWLKCLLCQSRWHCDNVEKHVSDPIHSSKLAELESSTLIFQKSFERKWLLGENKPAFQTDKLTRLDKTLFRKRCLLRKENQLFLNYFPESKKHVCSLCNLIIETSANDKWVQHFQSDHHLSQLKNFKFVIFQSLKKRGNRMLRCSAKDNKPNDYSENGNCPLRSKLKSPNCLTVPPPLINLESQLNCEIKSVESFSPAPLSIEAKLHQNSDPQKQFGDETNMVEKQDKSIEIPSFQCFNLDDESADKAQTLESKIVPSVKPLTCLEVSGVPKNNFFKLFRGRNDDDHNQESRDMFPGQNSAGVKQTNGHSVFVADPLRSKEMRDPSVSDRLDNSVPMTCKKKQVPCSLVTNGLKTFANNSLVPISHEKCFQFPTSCQRRQFDEIFRTTPDQINFFCVEISKKLKLRCLLCDQMLGWTKVEQHVLSWGHSVRVDRKRKSSSFNKVLTERQCLLSEKDRKFLDYFPTSKVSVCVLCKLILSAGARDRWFKHFFSDYHTSRFQNLPSDIPVVVQDLTDIFMEQADEISPDTAIPDRSLTFEFNLQNLKFSRYSHGTQFVKLIQKINDRINRFSFRSIPHLKYLKFICNFCHETFFTADTAARHLKKRKHFQNVEATDFDISSVPAIGECSWTFLKACPKIEKFVCTHCKASLPCDFNTWLQHLQNENHIKRSEKYLLPITIPKSQDIDKSQVKCNEQVTGEGNGNFPSSLNNPAANNNLLPRIEDFIKLAPGPEKLIAKEGKAPEDSPDSNTVPRSNVVTVATASVDADRSKTPTSTDLAVTPDGSLFNGTPTDTTTKTDSMSTDSNRTPSSNCLFATPPKWSSFDDLFSSKFAPHLTPAEIKIYETSLKAVDLNNLDLLLVSRTQPESKQPRLLCKVCDESLQVTQVNDHTKSRKHQISIFKPLLSEENRKHLTLSKKYRYSCHLCRKVLVRNSSVTEHFQSDSHNLKLQSLDASNIYSTYTSDSESDNSEESDAEDDLVKNGNEESVPFNFYRDELYSEGESSSSNHRFVQFASYSQSLKFLKVVKKLGSQINLFSIRSLRFVGHEHKRTVELECLLCKQTLANLKEASKHIFQRKHLLRLADDRARSLIKPYLPTASGEPWKFLRPDFGRKRFFCTLCELEVMNDLTAWIEHFQSESHLLEFKSLSSALSNLERCILSERTTADDCKRTDFSAVSKAHNFYKDCMNSVKPLQVIEATKMLTPLSGGSRERREKRERRKEEKRKREERMNEEMRKQKERRNEEMIEQKERWNDEMRKQKERRNEEMIKQKERWNDETRKQKEIRKEGGNKILQDLKSSEMLRPLNLFQDSFDSAALKSVSSIHQRQFADLISGIENYLSLDNKTQSEELTLICKLCDESVPAIQVKMHMEQRKHLLKSQVRKQIERMHDQLRKQNARRIDEIRKQQGRMRKKKGSRSKKQRKRKEIRKKGGNKILLNLISSKTLTPLAWRRWKKGAHPWRFDIYSVQKNQKREKREEREKRKKRREKERIEEERERKREIRERRKEEKRKRKERRNEKMRKRKERRIEEMIEQKERRKEEMRKQKEIRKDGGIKILQDLKSSEMLTPLNLFQDSFDSAALKSLSNIHQRQFANLISEIDYQINYFSLDNKTRSKELTLICKLCDESVPAIKAKMHTEQQKHLLNLFSKCNNLFNSANASYISDEDWNYLDFNEDLQEYVCTLCDAELSSCKDSWVQHFLGVLHSLKSKESQISNSANEFCISDEDWNFLDFDANLQEYLCTLCNVKLLNCEDSWAQHFLGDLHSLKSKELQIFENRDS